ncbi:hypothetical protein PYW08_015640 [Mythimna loreyi]|uniref:Uncharacterized protein n=1 Tax=Mythimna loreyi TaxID=667449 RepID=A0ACC2QX68_9NEOP|nr:hypothetical protein PYW08_015640 [Mythimna loreyi]
MSSILGKCLFLLGVLFIVPLDCEIYQDRPKIKTRGGDLIIEPAFDKNIYLRPNGPKSSIFVGDVNLLHPNTQSEGTQPQPSNNENTNQNINGILERLQRLESKESTLPNDFLFNISLLWRKVNNIHRKVINLQNQLNNRGKDECESHPCEHGGTCLNLVNGYHCLCPSNWEGRDCDVDVNECRNFAGTDLGCQNGATCINRPGSYECLCKSGWFGLHCTRKAKDCSGGDFEMCGHGTCVQVSSGEGVQCICHQGWTTNGTGGVACLTDINECESNQGPRCSVNPKVDCINLPGSFRCGQCPSGYEGDGYTCYDIDECTTIVNGGCSPLVTCHNTIGSRICGSCPPGYQGDGVTCSWRGTCNIGHGGCHPSAQCIESASPTGQSAQCICPDGTEGDGVGISGCYIAEGEGNSTGGCEVNPCGIHGQCHSLRTGYTCICFRGYGGAHCEMATDVCRVNPCHNRGICRADDSAIGGFRCECAAQYSGTLCQVRTKSCGGVLDNEEGSIVYPLTNTTYNHNSQCAWVIHTAPDKVINVTFSKFNLEGSPECMYDFLQIHDGRKSSSQLLGRFCGNNFPKGGNIVSSHNNLYFWFHSDKTVAKDGFALHWTSITPVCGGEVDATTHGHISSPGSPGPYPPNRDCYWHLTTSLGKRINLHFFALDVETHSNCSFDFLAIYDGEHVTDPLINRYCNTTQPAPVQSAGSDMLIHFHSDAYGSGHGFQIAYAPVEGIPGCGGYYTTEKGELVSPTYDGHYLSNLLCEYKIKTGLDTKIKIEFKSFKLEQSFRCLYDYLKIYDGPSPDSRLVGKFCGTTFPKTYTSSSNELYFIFKTDRSMPADGFRITYEAICEKTFEGDSGVIKSPGYPFSYPENKVCVYIIKTVPGKAIQLTFQDFDIEDNRYFDCRYDSVEVRDGHDQNSTLLGRFCGGAAHTPPVQTSTLNYMYIKFTSDLSISGTGFYANYTTIDTECGGIHRDTTGLINHPSGDDTTYQNYQTCKWLLIAPEGMHIKITWNRFDLEDMPSCGSDYLELLEIDENNENNVLGKFCGNHAPPALTTSTNRLMINFESDGSIRSSGFSMSYTFLDEKTHCGGSYIRTYGFIYSPGWPRSYEPNRDCTWIITVPVGQQIMLNISQFNLERPIRDKCNLGDFLEIRNGGNENSPLIGQYCGVFQSKRIVSLSNALHLHFHSDFYLTGTGFKIEWDGTITGCGGTLTSPSGSVTSPNYPNDYNENAECFYKIVTSEGSRIRISFTELDLERTPNCRDDYVEIFDGRDTSATVLGKHCYMSPDLATIETTTNYAYVKFRSDVYQGGPISTKTNTFQIKFSSGPYMPRAGFRLEWINYGCGGHIKDTMGTVSLDKSQTNDQEIDCEWLIETQVDSPDKKIYLTLTLMSLPKNSNVITNRSCPSSFLRVLDGDDNSAPLIGEYCGKKVPPMIVSRGSALTIEFGSYTGRVTGMFAAHYSPLSNACGGALTSEEGTIASPNYPGPYPVNTDCEWVLKSSPGNSAYVQFERFDLEFSEGCNDDYVEIRETNGAGRLLGVYCSSETPKNHSVASQIYVKFHSDSQTSGQGFLLHYGFQRQNDITGESVPYSECEWVFTGPPGEILRLDFIDRFDLDNEDDCATEAVEIRFGATKFSPLHGRFCGNDKHETIKSTGNTMYIKYITQIQNPRNGFKANVSIDTCGGTIVTDAGELKSPGYPHLQKLRDGTVCEWHIIGPPRHIFRIKPEDIQLPQSEVSCGTKITIEESVLINNTITVIKNICNYEDHSQDLIETSSNEFSIKLYIGKPDSWDQMSENRGFRISFNSSRPMCGGIVTESDGYLTTPSYPQETTIRYCQWQIRVPNKSRRVRLEIMDMDAEKHRIDNEVALTFLDFELEGSTPDCISDNLTISSQSDYSYVFKVYCGDKIPSVTTHSEKISLIFKSDRYIQRKGFRIAYVIYSCGGRVNESTVLTSSPSEIYDINMNCTWFIEAPANKIVVLKFLYIDLESRTDCYNDYIAFYDGQKIDTDKRLALMCGNINSTTTLRSKGNTALLQFVTDSSLNMRGFKVQVYFSYSEAAKCGGLINLTTASSQALNSPFMGHSVYEDYLDCHWSIVSPPDTVIKIVFTSFHVAPCQNVNQTALGYSKCDCDLVEIKDGLNPNSLVIGTYCGHSLPPQLTSSGNVMNVRLSTDGEIGSQGFVSTLTAQRSICGNSIISVNDTPQTLKSPGYEGGSIPRGLHCVYHLDVSASPYTLLRITVKDLDLQPPVADNAGVKRCNTDKLIISSNPTPINVTLGKDYILSPRVDDFFSRYSFYDSSLRFPDRFELCGQKEPTDFYVYGTTSINLMTSAESDSKVHKGVEIETAFTGFCGRNYTEPYGRVQAPYVSDSGFNHDCYTLITAPVNYTISVYFLRAIPSYWNADCYLEIFDGNNTTATSLSKIHTEYENNKPVFSSGRYLLFHNHENSGDRVMFDVNYVISDKGRGCGGKLHSVLGKVTSPLYPNVYRQVSSCEWELETPLGTRLLLHFATFDLGITCDQNYVQLVDSKGVVVRTFCEDTPADYTSDDNFVKIVFVTTMNNGGTGWVAEFIGIV